jgi:hypothetical protein
MSDLGFVLSLAVPVPRSIQFIRFFISVRGGSMRETCGYLFFLPSTIGYGFKMSDPGFVV